MGARSTKCFCLNVDDEKFDATTAVATLEAGAGLTDEGTQEVEKEECTYDVVDARGHHHKLPVRLESTALIVYGFADPKKVEAEMRGEHYEPVLVGGKAVVSIWFQNVHQSDYGGHYLETSYNTFVHHTGLLHIVGGGKLKLDYESPFSVFIQDPHSAPYQLRSLVSESGWDTGAGALAVEVGKDVFAFPQHNDLGKMSFKYDGKCGLGAPEYSVNVEHSGKQAVSLRMVVPKKGMEGTLTTPMEVETAEDALISGPRITEQPKQTRYGVHYKCTQHVQRWNPETDSLEFGDDDHFASPIKSWNFEPILKIHSPDFKMILRKPVNCKATLQSMGA